MFGPAFYLVSQQIPESKSQKEHSFTGIQKSSRVRGIAIRVAVYSIQAFQRPKVSSSLSSQRKSNF